jgi:hypothetical protein
MAGSPTRDSPAAAIETVDAATGRAPAYDMLGCALPTHFTHVLESDAAWITRLRGLRANHHAAGMQSSTTRPSSMAATPKNSAPSVQSPARLPAHKCPRRLPRHGPSARGTHQPSRVVAVGSRRL